ncbi:MAG: hypothetical protein AAF928_11810 [Myxococcota bacterium]
MRYARTPLAPLVVMAGLATTTMTTGCTDTGREATSVALFVSGTENDDPRDIDGFEVVLTDARLAFGPLYLCTGAQAGQLCETALFEWLDAVEIDLLDSRPRRAGQLDGVTGVARSWMYDVGITSLFTLATPLVLPAAERLDGGSLFLEGRASSSDLSYRFRAVVPVQQSEDTEQGVSVVRKSVSEFFERDVSADGERLDITFDVAPWVAQVDFAALGEAAAAADARVDVEPDTQAFRALRNAILSGARPEFRWSLE